MLRKLKLAAVSGASTLGVTKLIGASSWRRHRLLILCYHGISLRDEHLWAPALFVEQKFFRNRMERLRALRCNVLPLSEAIERLYRGDLPDRSVAVTFDDGWQGFYSLAFPVLKELEIPTTLYLTTYYSNFNRPVFDTMVRYLAWKSGTDVKEIDEYVRCEQPTGQQKEEFQAALAKRAGIDYDAILRDKFMHLMTPREVKEVAEGGIDVQLHTHRHRVSTNRERFNREIEDNREQIRLITGTSATHFCYPGGNSRPEFEGWLKALGVRSATTCITSLCSNESNRYFLPRLLDSATMETSEFDAWLTGFGDLLPKREYAPAEGQFFEDWETPGP